MDSAQSLYSLMHDGDCTVHETSVLSAIISEVTTNPLLLEAFNLGIIMANRGRISETIHNTITQRTAVLMDQRETTKFISNFLSLLNIKTIDVVSREKSQTTHDIVAQTISKISALYPEVYHPDIYERIAKISPIPIFCISDVIKFNHLVHNIKKCLIKAFQTSSYYQRLSEIDADLELFELQKNQKGCNYQRDCNRFLKNHETNKFVSIDVRQASFTCLFLYLAKSVMRYPEEYGLGFEKKYQTMEEMTEKFTWADYIDSVIEPMRSLCQIADNDTYCIVRDLIKTSKPIREFVCGKMMKVRLPCSQHNLLTIVEAVLKRKMIELAKYLEKYHTSVDITAVSMDEIILKGIDRDVVMNSLRCDENNIIFLNHLHVTEFVVTKHQLMNGKEFYVKVSTHGEPPILRNVPPEKRMEAWQIYQSSCLV